VCECGSSEITVTITGDTLVARSTSSCAGITVDLINMWTEVVTCAVGKHSLLGIPEVQVSNTLAILANFKEAKEADPNTCDYFEYVPLIQQLIVRIVEEGLCN
jgi:hypothetical protein